MGRTLKRVSLDFHWPLNKVWEGYVNPYYKLSRKCTKCDGGGYHPDGGKIFRDQWYGYRDDFDPVAHCGWQIAADNERLMKWCTWQCNRTDGYANTSQTPKQYAEYLVRLWKHQWSHHLNQDDVQTLVDARRLMDFTCRPRCAEHWFVLAMAVFNGGSTYWLSDNTGHVPTALEVNEWAIGSMGHDAINASICIKARCQRENVPCTCNVCNGTGTVWPDPEDERRYEKWTEEEPPTGPGYQLWETTSEGSPISPVFSTLDDLCRYAAEHCSTFGNFRASAEEWREMLDADRVHHREGNNIFI